MDTGLASCLAGWTTPEALETGAGAFFETFCVAKFKPWTGMCWQCPFGIFERPLCANAYRRHKGQAAYCYAIPCRALPGVIQCLKSSIKGRYYDVE
jgi:hypothetical protein